MCVCNIYDIFSEMRESKKKSQIESLKLEIKNLKDLIQHQHIIQARSAEARRNISWIFFSPFGKCFMSVFAIPGRKAAVQGQRPAKRT